MIAGTSVDGKLVSNKGMIEHGCPPVRRDNPRALASGLSTVQADKPCCLTCSMIPSVDLAFYGYLVLKSWLSWKCATNLNRTVIVTEQVQTAHNWILFIMLEKNSIY